MHCSGDLQVPISANISSNLGPMILFIHLKLFCYSIFSFQFLAINGIQTYIKLSQFDHYIY